MSDRKNYSLNGVYDDLFTSAPLKKTNEEVGPSEHEQTLKAIENINALCDEIFTKTTANNLEPTVPKAPLVSSPTPAEDQSPEDIKKDIAKLIGLSQIKEDIDALMDFIKVQQLRKNNNLPDSGISLHTAFIGNPGTGKTTIARLMGKYFQAIGILKKGHLVEVSRADLVAEHVGGTAVKTNKVIDSALDGILFIDEAYSLSTGSDNDYGREAIHILVDRMEKERGRLAIFFAGYDGDMNAFFASNAGLSSRVTRKFYFNDYNGVELLQIFQRISDQEKYILNDDALSLVKSYFDYIYFIRDDNFGNGREVRNTFEKLIKSQADRIANIDNLDKQTLMTLTAEDVEKAIHVSEMIVSEDDLASVFDELNQYVGLANIKEHIQNLVNLVKTNQKRLELGLPVKQMTFHAIFSGSPGTGKTSIARILGKIYRSLGILKKGHLVEVDRSGLVGSYVGQTEVKTSEVIDRAIDGILFIDEAYSLMRDHNDYGKIAIDTVLKRMDDDRDRLIVIVAGYTQEMNAFVDTNPGLKDRFTQNFEFLDYDANELVGIFMLLADKQKYSLSPDATAGLKEYFDGLLLSNIKNFGNGRSVRNFFERVVMVQANRLTRLTELTREELSHISIEDIHMAIGSK